MASIVTIGLAEGEERVVKIEAGKSAQKVFTVSNIFGSRLRMGFQCQFEKSDQKDWAKLRGAVEIDLDAQGSEQVTLDFAPPKGAAPGRYTCKLLVFSIKDPDLNFTLSDPIVLEIPEPQPVVKEEKKIWPWVLAGVAGLLVIGGIVTWLILASGTKVPNLVGMPVDEALALIEKKGLKSVIHEKMTGKAQTGQVIAQTPEPGTKLDDGQAKPVNLEVEAFSIAVPDLKGMSLADATQKLKLDGLAVGKVDEKQTGAPGGSVLDSKPSAGERVGPESPVNLLIETKTVQVPNVTGQLLAEATKTIDDLGLRTRVEMVQTNAQPLRVLSTKPTAGNRLQQGEVVTLVVEKQLVSVPNLIGQNINSATDILKRSNLRVGSVRYQFVFGKPMNSVYAQTPSRGASVDPLTPVTLYVYGVHVVTPSTAVMVPFTNVHTLKSMEAIRREAPPLETK